MFEGAKSSEERYSHLGTILTNHGDTVTNHLTWLLLSFILIAKHYSTLKNTFIQISGCSFATESTSIGILSPGDIMVAQGVSMIYLYLDKCNTWYKFTTYS